MLVIDICLEKIYTTKVYLINHKILGVNMKSSKLKQLITQTTFRRIFFPIIIFICLVLLVLKTGIWQLIYTQTVYDCASITDSYNNDMRYINCSLSDLNYTGLDCSDKQGEIIGHYYYKLENNRCYYFLLSGEITENHLDQVGFICRLYSNPKQLGELNLLMASKLDWTQLGLTTISGIVIGNQAVLEDNFIFIFLYLCIAGLALSLLHIVLIALAAINVNFSSTVRHLNRYGNAKMQFELAQAEYEGLNISQDGFVITSNFYIAYDRHNVHIVPLAEIGTAYKYATGGPHFFGHILHYSVNVSTSARHHYIVGHKNKEVADLALENLQKRCPGILLGTKSLT